MRLFVIVLSVLALVSVGCAQEAEEVAEGTPPATAEAPEEEEEAEPAPVTLEGDVNNHGTTDLAGATELEMELDDFYFEPTFVKAEPGATVTLELFNEGGAPHTFTNEDLDVDEELDPEDRTTVEVTLPDSGAVNFICRFHVDQGMQGAFFFEAGAEADDDTGSTGTGTGTGTGSTGTGTGTGGY